jgi:hypothetical protein
MVRNRCLDGYARRPLTCRASRRSVVCDGVRYPSRERRTVTTSWRSLQRRNSLQLRNKGAQPGGRDSAGWHPSYASTLHVGFPARVVSSGSPLHAVSHAPSQCRTRTTSFDGSPRRRSRAPTAVSEEPGTGRPAPRARRATQRSRPAGRLVGLRAAPVSARTTPRDERSSGAHRNADRSARVSPRSNARAAQ